VPDQIFDVHFHVPWMERAECCPCGRPSARELIPLASGVVP
jgi:hypothetical protein